jgi:hypothetical protein
MFGDLSPDSAHIDDLMLMANLSGPISQALCAQDI